MVKLTGVGAAMLAVTGGLGVCDSGSFVISASKRRWRRVADYAVPANPPYGFTGSVAWAFQPW